MCGFAGYIDLRGERRADGALAGRMAETLVHRGPDSAGSFVKDGVAMGFRRLSIIDLETGDQPHFNEDRSVVTMCNGEIFNYRELRAGLEAKGHRFRSQSDVEVLVHLYEEHGTDFLDLLNGQFAFVLYDCPRQRLFLARDHFGIAPLFYTRADNYLIFGSEIKALLRHPAIRPEVDLTGLDQIMSFPGLVSPRTMFNDIHALPAGQGLSVENGSVRTWTYWDMDYPRLGELSYDHPESYYVEELGQRLTRAVEFRLQADVPVGYYVSGGLDSSLIAALGKQVSPATQRGSFSIAFREDEISEAPYQRLMAEHLGTEHHEILFDWSEIAENLVKMIYHCECPVKETFNTCAMALSRAARAQGIPVILAGQGADELFAGYMGYRFDRRRAPEPDGFDLESLLEDELREKIWGHASIFYEKRQNAYREIKCGLYSAALNARFPELDCLEFPLVDKSRLAARDVLHQRSYLDLKLRLQEHLLSEHGDRMLLMSSVEGRYPFLDREVVRFARTVPPELKLKGDEEKYIVKKVAEGLVPSKIVNREKFGFRGPSSPYLLRQNIPWIRELLSYERIRSQGYFNADVVERLKAQYSADGFNLNAHLETDLLMVVLTFGIFLERFNLPALS